MLAAEHICTSLAGAIAFGDLIDLGMGSRHLTPTE
jgi:hypothetical protein